MVSENSGRCSFIITTEWTHKLCKYVFRCFEAWTNTFTGQQFTKSTDWMVVISEPLKKICTLYSLTCFQSHGEPSPLCSSLSTDYYVEINLWHLLRQRNAHLPSRLRSLEWAQKHDNTVACSHWNADKHIVQAKCQQHTSSHRRSRGCIFLLLVRVILPTGS